MQGVALSKREPSLGFSSLELRSLHCAVGGCPSSVLFCRVDKSGEDRNSVHVTGDPLTKKRIGTTTCEALPLQVA